jgi:preprotein translocase subunit SecF
MPVIFKSTPTFDYFRFHKLCFAVSILLCIVTAVSLATRGLNFGVDFAGGILMEVRTPGVADLADMRAKLNELNLGDVSLQEFGSPSDILIRVQRQGNEQEEQQAVNAIQNVLGPNIEYRRIEVVGPKVGGELIRDGIWAVVLSLGGIMAYMAFRFGWRAGFTGVVALIHDCWTTLGLYSVTGLQFDLTSVAVIVTIAGFSINDTVVIDDRIRENLRKYKAMDFRDLINRSINETMARTVMTNGLLFLAVLALVLFGGQVLQNFSIAMLWGVIVGTYSTIYVAAPLEWYMSRSHHKRNAAIAAGQQPADHAAAASAKKPSA